jgi:ankyrin repeat protein
VPDGSKTIVLEGVMRMKRSTKLEHAICEQNLEKVVRIVGKGVDLHVSDNSGRTFLHWAASHGNSPVVGFLIERKLSVDARTNFDFTPLHFANNDETARLLVAAGADINATNSASKERWNSLGNCPVHSAVWYERLDVLDALLELTGNINCQNLDGTAPIHEAAGFHDADFLASIISRGGDVNVLDAELLSPLHYALENNKNQEIRTLVNAGAIIPTNIQAEVENILRVTTD